MSLVQIERLEGRIARVPKGETPIIELNLDEDTAVLNVARLEPIDPYSRRNEERKTLDWRYVVYVEWRMWPLERGLLKTTVPTLGSHCGPGAPVGAARPGSGVRSRPVDRGHRLHRVRGHNRAMMNVTSDRPRLAPSPRDLRVPLVGAVVAAIAIAVVAVVANWGGMGAWAVGLGGAAVGVLLVAREIVAASDRELRKEALERGLLKTTVPTLDAEDR